MKAEWCIELKEQRKLSDNSSDPHQFAGSSGYRNDGDVGLTYVGARYYDAQVGRFITRDTYLDQKPYLYCEHEPVNRLDPSGHASFRARLVAIADAIAIMIVGPTHHHEYPHLPEKPPPSIVKIEDPPAAGSAGGGGEGPAPPGGDDGEPGSGGGPGAIVTIGYGIGTGAEAVHYALQHARAIQAAIDSIDDDGNPADDDNFGNRPGGL